ncbi:MAG: Flp pilus assembly complex ATPase component TadA [Epsilonproteobacteria bacterium]|nr:Flp pilus assembly complex ATPase component TadA [Campylobacterota bacterium]
MKTKLFKGINAVDTKKIFMESLTPNQQWYGKLLYGIREGWIKNGCNITEILIQEMQPISIAVLKAYLPCPVRFDDDEFLPTKGQILGVVERFTEISPGNNGEALIGNSIDFAFQVFGLGIFRNNFSFSNNGCTLSIRYLPHEVPKLEDVGYPDIYRNYLKNIIEKVAIKSPPPVGEYYIQCGEGVNPIDVQKPVITTINTQVPRSGGGLILHIGPTGSGKTTAMAAEVGHIADQTAALILTYEDPIEFSFVGTTSPVSSFELGRDIKENEDFTLPEMVRRHSLRKNPAVIMFGEMRTSEQMRMVVDMANSGHWVLASMHGQSVLEAVGVLASIYKDEPYVLANSLKAAVAHRLATNQQGNVIPLFEIFIPDDVRTTALAKGNLDEIKRTFKEGLGDQSVTFEQSIEFLVRNNKITMMEKDRIRKMALGNIKTVGEKNV